MNPSLKGQAAVLIPVAEVSPGEHSILFTLRAEHLSSHSGEVAFPGGMWEQEDASLEETALRESHEEVALPPTHVEISQELSVEYTRQGRRVTPYVGHVNPSILQSLEPNPEELSALFWVPLAYLLKDPRVQTDVFSVMGKEYWAPRYQWQEYEIWGFTARVLVDFLNSIHNAGFVREHTAPEKLFTPLA